MCHEPKLSLANITGAPAERARAASAAIVLGRCQRVVDQGIGSLEVHRIDHVDDDQRGRRVSH